MVDMLEYFGILETQTLIKIFVTITRNMKVLISNSFLRLTAIKNCTAKLHFNALDS